MKKSRLRGFTLIECLIAMAILGVSSLLIVQAYTQLMRVTNMNNAMQVSISRQMATAEAGLEDNVYVNKYRSGDTFKIKATYAGVTTPSGGTNYNGTSDEYQCKVDVYAVYGQDNGGTVAENSTDANDVDANSVRFVYFHGQ